MITFSRDRNDVARAPQLARGPARSGYALLWWEMKLVEPRGSGERL